MRGVARAGEEGMVRGRVGAMDSQWPGCLSVKAINFLILYVYVHICICMRVYMLLSVCQFFH